MKGYLIRVGMTALAFTLVYSYGSFRQNAALKAELNAARIEAQVERSNVAAKQEALDQALRANSALQFHFDRVTESAAYWRKKASNLALKEGANETLNPYERAVLDSLRGE